MQARSGKGRRVIGTDQATYVIAVQMGQIDAFDRAGPYMPLGKSLRHCPESRPHKRSTAGIDKQEPGLFAHQMALNRDRDRPTDLFREAGYRRMWREKRERHLKTAVA
ncbi:hypothetical protein AA12717_0448 [Gluconacetobacter sacchari DSM 12717]|uniref:Transposase n=1 Tax=Gluconacetobacter sacchari DSM 12717 TaxID=1307940 RepID=A0ABQ0P2S5_9PROT|nr:hypothetical protein AA12717_0448 [Gluconacetobacter sacchari DSM 12717]